MAAPAQFIDYVAAERLATSFDVGAAMLLVYDCSLTLGMEIEFVWSSPWGFMTVLYIVQRYLPFCDAIFLCLPPQLAANIDPHGCLIVNMIRGWLMIFGWILSEVSTKPYPEFVGCFFTSANHIVYVNWVVFMIYEAGPSFPLAHKLPFQIGEEGMLICITSYMAKRRSARHIHCAKAAKALSIVNVVVVCALSREYLAVIATPTR
ncbi:uncharacterized protein LACBIDRAFT_332138 [Laccaria bicolor S238N-H82]|uniref:Predicted protein n=1 Tax=Laccaria bicolor (strain S238N-H82 / ATCC MYA-4686) TaxID=486041 RepID=B0DRQ4_LACBS|nr:uncharacterized protein LACBIDRAFT_332138 [Laccaria bicolor S238N-H82]EDR02574.1 predicted protein [Laccaria bicolor S238N-H82]|eukprot:XP_001886618.1 predicted protein [Laccaria bicolor S238N-H82]